VSSPASSRAVEALPGLVPGETTPEPEKGSLSGVEVFAARLVAEYWGIPEAVRLVLDDELRRGRIVIAGR
jgi:hypothetical protein